MSFILLQPIFYYKLYLSLILLSSWNHKMLKESDLIYNFSLIQYKKLRNDIILILGKVDSINGFKSLILLLTLLG
jgi:hypothetical protein